MDRSIGLRLLAVVVALGLLLAGAASAQVVIEDGSPHFGWYVFNEPWHEVQDYGNIHLEEHNLWGAYGWATNNGNAEVLVNMDMTIYDEAGRRMVGNSSNVRIAAGGRQPYNTIPFGPETLPPGRYRAVFTIRNENGDIIDQEERWFTIAEPEERPRIRVTPDPLDFGSVRAGQSLDRDVIVDNIGDQGSVLNVTNNYTDPDDYFTIVRGEGDFSVRQGEQGYPITIRFTSRTPAGQREARLMMFSNNAGAQQTSTRLVGVVQGVPDISCTRGPDNPLNFGRINVGEVSRESFYVNNVGDEGSVLHCQLELRGADRASFQIETRTQFSLERGSSELVIVVFTPLRGGDFVAEIAIQSNDPDENPYYVPLIGGPVQRVEVENASPPHEIEIANAYPNPFNESVNIEYSLTGRQPAAMEMLDTGGHLVANLASGPRAAGRHLAQWRPDAVSPGVYFIVLRSGGEVRNRKIVYLK